MEKKLRLLHSDRIFPEGRGRLSLDYWRKQPTPKIVESLAPAAGNPEALRIRSDDVVMQGNTRVKVLIECGYNIDGLPFEPYE